MCFNRVLKNNILCVSFSQIFSKTDSTSVLHWTDQLLMTFYSTIPEASTDQCIVDAIHDSFCHCLSHCSVSLITFISYCQNFDLFCYVFCAAVIVASGV
jgi:hypothetical protein